MNDKERQELFKEIERAYFLEDGKYFTQKEKQEIEKLLKNPLVIIIYQAGFSNGYENF